MGPKVQNLNLHNSTRKGPFSMILAPLECSRRDISLYRVEKEKTVTTEKTYNGVAQANNLNSSQLDAQGPVFDDAGAVEMLSTRSIILEGRI